MIWPPAVQTELTATAGASRSHFAILFDMRRGLFQVETPSISGTRRKMQKQLTLKRQIAVVVNDNCIIAHVHTLLHVARCEMLTM